MFQLSWDFFALGPGCAASASKTTRFGDGSARLYRIMWPSVSNRWRAACHQEIQLLPVIVGLGLKRRNERSRNKKDCDLLVARGQKVIHQFRFPGAHRSRRFRSEHRFPVRFDVHLERARYTALFHRRLLTYDPADLLITVKTTCDGYCREWWITLCVTTPSVSS